ncbi:helix-turn-helix domain-containing protein [Hydrogenophaga sp.]|uniref:helix-turn-helix domain-containing protein n=1 Tax=Hydrogenophaga sp. TaxID=1904254 RepID=UPI00272845EC|nr:helix-turn-helix transcriptional regulator [Hydrogenophaga sp.]MDO9437307.1 helix-turn-helix transcriptional regulator [Hydrogenophaga sp.]
MQSAPVSRQLHSTKYAKLREVLTAERLSAGLTQSALADRLKRPQSFVSKFEIGERHLDVIEFIGICKALGVDPKEILGKVVR